MVRVAIAGGTGGIGRTLAESILATRKHNVFVLSRDDSTTFAGNPDVKTLKVDYSSPIQISEILKANNIHTVISAIGVLYNDTHEAQMNLIDGAAKAGTVRRFAPSEGYPIDLPGLEGYMASHYKVQAIEKLKGTKMEYTSYIIGFLMDYYCFPIEPVNVLPLAAVLDVDNCKAAVPAEGSDLVTLTHSKTIGAFVDTSLDLPKWPEKSWIMGDTVTWNHAINIAEEARGI
ncbi:hypothetical protein DL95DRAFT_308064 [Leptodontidium sp. 2 PMI_412]|nr:hypothetical protein DL95DRAFT_308064 [Leptodontidium sp. 2 PMI_412]